MKTVNRMSAPLSLLFFIALNTHATEPAPVISSINHSNNTLQLSISDLSTGGTYYVESSSDLTTNNWAEAGLFEGHVGSTNWSDSVSGSTTSKYYRVVRETYHPKVGEVATFGPNSYGIAGTAHIVNNHTLELRNFSFDAVGIDVRVYISPNPTFVPGFSLGTNLVRPFPFTNETLTYTLPEGTDLTDYCYISIWCVPVGVDFGSGQFQ